MEGYGKQEKIKSLTRLWFDQNKKLNGWFTPYTSKKAKHTAYVTTNGPTFLQSKRFLVMGAFTHSLTTTRNGRTIMSCSYSDVAVTLQKQFHQI